MINGVGVSSEQTEKSLVLKEKEVEEMRFIAKLKIETIECSMGSPSGPRTASSAGTDQTQMLGQQSHSNLWSDLTGGISQIMQQMQPPGWTN